MVNTIIQKYSDYRVSTKTFVITTNITVDIENFFNHLESSTGSNIKTGYIRRVYKGNKMKKDGTEYELNGRPFRNSFTIDMFVNNKFINSKFSRNGTFQMTGARTNEHAEEFVKIIWSKLRDTKFWSFTNGNTFTAMFIPYMSNINFNLGFRINRERLNSCIIHMVSYDKNYLSSFQPSTGHPGVNIKFPCAGDLMKIKMKTIRIDGDKATNGWGYYSEYLNRFPNKKRLEKLDKKMTFLVFNTGSVIMSGGLSDEKSEIAYNYFMDFVKKYRKYFELGKVSNSFFRGSIAAVSVLNKRLSNNQ